MNRKKQVIEFLVCVAVIIGVVIMYVSGIPKNKGEKIPENTIPASTPYIETEEGVQ